MDALDHAIRIAAAWTAVHQGRRAAVADALAAIGAAYTEAIQVWQDFAATEVRPAGSPWSLANWLGACRIERLQAIEMRVNENFAFIAHETGAPLEWNFPHDRVGLAVAERVLLRTGAGEDAARCAADALAARAARLQRALRELGLA